MSPADEAAATADLDLAVEQRPGGRASAKDAWPHWLIEIDSRLAVSPHFVLVGNTHDLHHIGGSPPLVRTEQALTRCLEAAGYLAVFRWNVFNELSVAGGRAPDTCRDLLEQARPGKDPAHIGLTSAIGAVAGWDPQGNEAGRVALVLEGPERLAPQSGDPLLNSVVAQAQQFARSARRGPANTDDHGEIHNAIFWLVDREQSLPHWFLSTPGVHVVSMPLPELGTRKKIARVLLGGMRSFRDMDTSKQEQAVELFASRTSGMSARTMDDAYRFALDRAVPAEKIDEAVHGLQTGLRQSPWRDPDLRQKIKTAEKTLTGKIRGQDTAVGHSVHVLSRSALGLSGAHADGHRNRPKGVLFLAGPTGVGKTELAKQISRLVFGESTNDDDSLVRFDMAEFGAEHAKERLIGAPPGYIGFEGGGELTNAIRRRPFSVVLFDEIEKASTELLKIFLGILEDGRLTDGAGNTVYFGETLIAFTSNLGQFERDQYGNSIPDKPLVNPDDDPHDVRRAVRDAVKKHFNGRVGMPELLNRIGQDNIVVFDFIRPEIAVELMHEALDSVVGAIRANAGISVTILRPVIDHLEWLVRQPENRRYGGRGAKAIVESRFTDPLAPLLLDYPPGSDISADLDVENGDPGTAPPKLTVRQSRAGPAGASA